MQPSALEACRTPRTAWPGASGAGGQSPRSPAPTPIPWGDAYGWAKEVGLHSTAVTFRWALMPASVLDSVAGEAVGHLSDAASVGPAFVAAVGCGVAAASLGQSFAKGFETGHKLGVFSAHLLLEAPYRMTMFGLIAGAAGASVAVGAGMGALTLAVGTAAVASERACTKAAQSARSVFHPLDEALDAGDGRLG